MVSECNLHVDKNLKLSRPQLYQEVSEWIMENVPGKNMPEKTLKMANFYKKHYNKPPIVTLSKEIMDQIEKTINLR